MRVVLRVIFIICILGAVTPISFGEFLTSSPVHADQLQREISEFHASRLGSIDPELEELEEVSPSHSKGDDYVCTGGVKPSKLSRSKYLEAFAKGPCTPVAVLAGITGTKLRVQIDCQALKNGNPALFKDCGWSSCSKSLFADSPEKEYAIWLPKKISPFTLLNPSKQAGRCLVGLFRIEWKKVGNKLQQSASPGVKIMPLGLTQETSKEKFSKCGFEAISNILGIAKILTPEKYKIFNALRVKLEAKGYVMGLTATAIPYDWRVPISHNGMASKMIKVLETLKSITGKRVSIVAHSMGNINTLNMLNKMDQSKKDQLIQRYFALAPPYTGAPKAFSMLLGGSDAFQFGIFGITFNNFKKMVSTFTAVYDLMPRTFWSRFDQAPWMKSIQNRIKSEAGQKPESLSPEDDVVSKYLPKKEESCKADNWKNSPKNCVSGLADLRTFGSVVNDPIRVDNIKEILRKYSFDSMAPTFLDSDGTREEFDKMPNPGVETVIMYGNSLKTAKEFIWNYDPKPKAIKSGADYQEATKEVNALGDGTVLTASAIGPGLKWAWEFDNQVPGSKPVIFAELCSEFNKVSNVYQDESENSVTKSAYQGVDCECNSGKDKDCDHVGLVSDKYTVNYIVDSLMDHQTPASPRLFDGQKDSQIESYQKSCSVITQLM